MKKLLCTFAMVGCLTLAGSAWAGQGDCTQDKTQDCVQTPLATQTQDKTQDQTQLHSQDCTSTDCQDKDNAWNWFWNWLYGI